MLNLFLIGLMILVAIALVPLSWYIITKSNFKWLAGLTSLIIYSFPFERIPSIETTFGSFRPVQFLVIFGFLLFFLLFIKKDPELMKRKLHPISIWFIAFFVVSVPSLFNIQNQGRFLSAYFATLIAFGAAFLIANFGQNLWQTFKNSCLIYLGVLVFSYYQFIGDFIGLPMILTGIKPIFASNVFGIPRIHATFNEPSYYGNALFLFIFSFFFLLITKTNIFKKATQMGSSNWLSKFNFLLYKNYQFFYILVIFGFLSAFLLTIAKSAWIVAPLVFIPALIVGFKFFDLKYFIDFSVKFLIVGSVLLSLLLSFSTQLQYVLVYKVIDHLSETLKGNTATVQERSIYFDSAVEVIPEYIISGIGPGQYGTYAKNIIVNSLDIAIPISEIESTITFNVYIEVWLEYGFFAFIIFLYIFLKTTIVNLFRALKNYKTRPHRSILQLVFGFYMLASLLQWNYISPIYIYPIFIALGILLNLSYTSTNTRADE